MIEVGDVVADRYSVLERLGAGGMGAVYLARDAKLERSVALKVIHSDQVEGSAGRARMLREARTAARLSHASIVEVYDVGETDDGSAFLVMEHVQGRTLRAVLRDGFERADVLRIVSETADALHAAHREGVIHRDVKPDNVMLRDDGRVVLLDFGLVKRMAAPLNATDAADTPTMENLTASGAIVGTPAYLAPEQARGRSSEATDQWALAVTAYELLSGEIPWIGAEPTHILAQVLMDPPAPLSERCDAPEAADAVLARALEKDPKDRFPDITLFATALRDAFAGESSDKAAPAPTEKRPREPLPSRTGVERASEGGARRRHTSWAAAAMVVLGAVGLLAWLGAGSDEDVSDSVAAVATLEDDAVVACPVLEVEGVDPPNRWFGAAAGNALCERMTLLLGGDGSRTRPPPVLLDLPALPTADFPDEPYGPASRETTLEAARSSDAWLDGTVTRDDDGSVSFEVELVSAAGVIARASARGDTLHRASTATLRALSEAGLPVADQMGELCGDSLCGGFAGPADPFELVHILDASLSAESARSGLDAESCGELVSDVRIDPTTRRELATACNGNGLRVERPDAELDESSPLRFLTTVVSHSRVYPDTDAAPWIARLRSDREQIDASLRPASRLAEAELLARTGQSVAARALYRTALEQLPRSTRGRILHANVAAPDSVSSLWPLIAAWSPDRGVAWMAKSAYQPGDAERSLEMMERAYLLDPYHAQVAEAYAGDLMGLDRSDEVRTLASRFLVLDEPIILGHTILALVDVRHGRFGRALETLTEAYGAYEGLGRRQQGDFRGWVLLLGLTMLLERQDVVDDLLQRFVLSDPHRLWVYENNYAAYVVGATLVSSSEVGLAAMGVLRDLRAANEGSAAVAGPTSAIDSTDAQAFFGGAIARLMGDERAAADAWRSIRGPARGYVPSDAFDAVGEYELARRFDAPRLENASFGGISLAHAREAERSEHLGEPERARELALQVIAAWETADVTVPAVARMRALLERLPSEEPEGDVSADPAP